MKVGNYLKNEAIKGTHLGECCLLKSCSKTAQPVCDDRGGTHLSLCHFQNTKCIHDKIHPQNALQLAYLGEISAKEHSKKEKLQTNAARMNVPANFLLSAIR